MKKRHSVTLEESYLNALKELVSKGIYRNNGEAIRDGLRYVFRKYGIVPFKQPLEIN